MKRFTSTLILALLSAAVQAAPSPELTAKRAEVKRLQAELKQKKEAGRAQREQAAMEKLNTRIAQLRDQLAKEGHRVH